MPTRLFLRKSINRDKDLLLYKGLVFPADDCHKSVASVLTDDCYIK